MTTKIFQGKNKANFLIGDYWVSLKRKLYKIIDVDENPQSYYPILVEDQETNAIFTANNAGELYLYIESHPDKLILKVHKNYKPKDTK